MEYHVSLFQGAAWVRERHPVSGLPTPFLTRAAIPAQCITDLHNLAAAYAGAAVLIDPKAQTSVENISIRFEQRIYGYVMLMNGVIEPIPELFFPKAREYNGALAREIAEQIMLLVWRLEPTELAQAS